MLGLGLARCDLGLSHGLAGHCHSEASAHAYGSDVKKAYLRV